MLPDWLTVEELKKRLDKQRTADDEVLENYLVAAFSQAQVAPPWGTGRTLVPTPALVPADPPTDPQTFADTADPVEIELTCSRRTIVLPDAREITRVEGSGHWFGSDVLIDPATYRTFEHEGAIVQIRLARQRHYLHHPGDPYPETVKVTGRFGFVTVPDYVREAIYTLAARMWSERAAQYSDQVASPDGGASQAYYRQLPPRVKLAFDSFKAPAGITGLS